MAVMYGACHRAQIAISIKCSFGFWNVFSKSKLAPVTLGEVGAIPPGVQSHKNVLTLYRRVAGMSENTIVKQVFMALYNLHNQGSQTLVSRVHNYDIDEPTYVPGINNRRKIAYLLDAQIITWLGKFLYHIFDKRKNIS